VLQGDCTLKQAMIKDKRNPNLFLLAASQTKDKNALTVDAVGKMLAEMRREFDFIICDSPAGIESGARHGMYFADDAIILTNPEPGSLQKVGREAPDKLRRDVPVDNAACAGGRGYGGKSG